MKLSDLQKKIMVAMLNREEGRLKKGYGKELSEDPVGAGVFGRRIVLRTLMKDLAVMEKGWGTGSATQFATKYGAVYRNVREAIRKLCTRRLMLEHILIYRGKPKRTYELTNTGRALAKKFRFYRKVEELRREGKLEEELKRQLEGALKTLKQEPKGKPALATPDEVLEALWESNKKWYEGERSIFDDFWNTRKLGRVIANLGYELTRRRVQGKLLWAYILNQSDDIFDMTAALAYLKKAKHMSNVDYWCILAALWLTTGSRKHPSKEALLAYWTRKRVGRAIKFMGFKSRRKTLRKETLRLYDIATISEAQLPEEISNIIVEAATRIDLFVDTRYEFIVAEERIKGKVAEKQETKEETAPEEWKEKTADSQSSISGTN